LKKGEGAALTLTILDRIGIYPHDYRGGKGRGKQRVYLCPLSRSLNYNLTHHGYKEATCCYVQERFLGMETKIFFSLLYSALFGNIFKALNIFLNKYVA
jgi:hypothetical protein